MPLETAHRYHRAELDSLCEVCKEQQTEFICESCDRTVCKGCGEIIYPKGEFLCHECIEGLKT